jgi:hypothetical protein
MNAWMNSSSPNACSKYFNNWTLILGTWTLRNTSRTYYLGADVEKLICTAKIPNKPETWAIHLAARPQVTLKSVGRKRYAHLSENGEEVHVVINMNSHYF